MKVKIKHNEELIDATIEMVDGVMVVTPKESKVDYSQFKDGDVITCGWEKKTIFCEWVCVLRGQIENVASNLYIEDYCSLDLKTNTGECKLTTTSGFSDAATYVRYATEEEKQKLFDALAKEGKIWDEKQKAVVDLKWRPTKDESYYCPLSSLVSPFYVHVDVWDESRVDIERYKIGWVFPYTEAGMDDCKTLCDRLTKAINSVKP